MLLSIETTPEAFPFSALVSIGGFMGALLLIAGTLASWLPEGFMPVRGKWRRPLLLGVGAVFALPWLAFILPLALMIVAAIWGCARVTGFVEELVTGRDSSRCHWLHPDG
jgi:hypothetical protein